MLNILTTFQLNDAFWKVGPRFLKGGCNVTSCIVCICNEIEYVDMDEGDQKIVLSFVVKATSNLSIE